MHHITPRRIVSLVVLFVVAGMLSAGLAVAAPVSLEDTEIWVQLWPEGEPGTSVVIVGVELPADTPLPATVQLPLPEGATVFWAGEIMGPDPSADLEREFKTVDTGSGQAVEFTAETTRTLQFDATVGSIVVDGNDLGSSLEWSQSVASASTGFAVLMPPGTGDTKITPEPPVAPQEGASGEKLYTLTGAILEPGDTYKIDVVYRRQGVQDVVGSSSSTILLVLGGLLLAAVVALSAAVMAQRRRS